MTRMRNVLLVAATLALAPTAALALDIQITVEEPLGVARTAEPISGGIPLPADQFKPDQAFALFDGEKEVPLQALPLVVEANGSLRWVLLDFQADLKAREKKAFTLKTVKGAATPAKPLAVKESADGVTVDTGVASLAISKGKPFGLFESTALNGKPVTVGGEVSYVDAFDGKRYVADKPTSVEVEYNGPMRATVCIKGGFVGDDQNKFLYIARVTAWAGRSDLLVKYTLANSNADHYCWRAVKDSSVVLTLAGPATGATLGTAKPLDAEGEASLCQGLRAGAAGGGKALAGEKELWSSADKEIAQGWLVAKAPAPLQVADLYFADDPARKLAVKGTSVTLAGVTERFDGAKDAKGRVVGQPFADKARYLPDCTHLSSFYLIDLAPAADPAAQADNARRGKGRIWAIAPLAWYFQTESLSVGKFGTQADELKCYETWGWKYDAARVPKEPGARIGRYVRSEDNHFETEEDIVESLLLMYLRTGQRAFFDATEAWLNFHLDLQAWRTDGWRWKDGGGWWHTGPFGNKPQRKADPVTGIRNELPSGKGVKAPFTPAGAGDTIELTLSKACHCHNWGEGVADWFCLTGDRDALETAIDIVENNYDFQKRCKNQAPGKAGSFSRDFTRSCYLTNATRMIVPADPFVVEASDFLASVYLQRTNKEPRGLANIGGPVVMDPRGFGFRGTLEKFVGKEGLAEMQRLGVTEDPKTGQLTDPKSGAKWYPIVNPNTWMFPPLSMAMDSYYRITGNEDAMDWTIAYAQAAAHVLYQRHGNQDGVLLADFPLKGVVKDRAAWITAEDNKYAEGPAMSGYLAKFHPDAAAHGYTLCGEPALKQRALDYWFAGSHRPYQGTKMVKLGEVGEWVNYYGVHSETVNFTGRMFYEWAHPRADQKPPAAVADLKASVDGEKATVTFTAPADDGGRAARYQVKCSDKPIVDYVTFLAKYAANEGEAVTNCWMAANVKGEPAPKAAGTAESFAVTGVPAGAKYFVVLTFDDSSNRGPMSNVAEAK